MNTTDLPSSTTRSEASEGNAPAFPLATGSASVFGCVIMLVVTAILHSWHGHYLGAIPFLIIAALVVHDHDRNNDFKKLLKIARHASDCLERTVKQNRELIKIIEDRAPVKTYFEQNNKISGDRREERTDDER